jgi:hypothetical protein
MLLAFCYLFYFVAATASPLQRRKLSQATHGSGQVAFAFRVSLVVAVLGLLLPLFSPLEIKGSWLTLSLLTLICSFFGAGSIATQYLAQKHVTAGVTTLVGNLYTPAAIIFGTTWLHEGLRFWQVLGATLLIGATWLVAKAHRIGRFRFDKYFWTMVASGIFLGIALTAERALIKTTGLSAGTLLSWWAQAGGLYVVALLFRVKTTFTVKETLLTGSLRYLQLLSWVMLVFVAKNLSVVSAVTTFKIVILFIFAAVFLHEREDLKRKVIGSLIAVIGLLLMT